MTVEKNNQFRGFFRNIFWPIHRSEFHKFFPIAALMFCIIFNQNILRILKDSILISEVSAEITSFAKVYVITPMAAIFVIIYAKMVNHWQIDKIFCYLISVFLAFYILFAFVIYPHVDYFHMDHDKMLEAMNRHAHLKWYIATIGNWSYVLFYALSELWPNIFYVLIFWQIANEVTNTNDAKRFYTLFSLFGNSSVIVVGLLMMSLSTDNNIIYRLFTISNDKIILTKISITLVCFASVISCILVKYITQNLVNDVQKINIAANKKLNRPKMSIVESIRYITRSKYLWLMLICSAAFGLTMNLVEAVWKAKIKELYPTVNSFAAFNSFYILWTGIVIVLMTIIGNNIMRKKSWFVAAIISPIIILITGSAFFFFVVADEYMPNLFTQIILVSPLSIAVFIGAVQNILSKASKYSILDSSTQMLYIPLDPELRTKGKAAVDVISPKIGKSASGIVQSITFTIFPMATYNSIAPILMLIFMLVCVIWLRAVSSIYQEYQKIVIVNEST
ncbi:MAG: NTP/NDP exchange transporter [Rickettsiaceae bacterium]|nr:NTP/NDP exchange transporter [Rickettsiaceae bacterium]